MDQSTERSASFEITQDAPFAAVQVDAAGDVTGWNTAAASLFAIRAADAVGRPLAAVLPVAGGAAAWQALLAEGRGARRVWAVGAVTCELTIQPLKAGGHLCYAQDVAGRAGATSQQQQIESQLLRAMLGSLDVIAWVIDASGKVLLHDGKGLERLGWAPGHLLGQSMLELYAGENFYGVLREGLAGKPSHHLGDLDGRVYETWQVPVPHGEGGAALIGLTLDATEARRREQELQHRLDIIERQQQAMRDMATPIIEVWDHVLCLPLVGLVDSNRTAEIMEALLQAVTRVRARYAILDLTGVDVLDTATVSHLLGLTRALRLLGAQAVLTGVHPNIAQTVVTLGVDLSMLTVRATLRDALKHVLVALDRR